MKKLVAGLATLLYLSGPPEAVLETQGSTSTYEQSMAAKHNMPCVKQILSKKQPDVTMGFLKKTWDATSDIRKVLLTYEPPDANGVARLMDIPNRYDECVALYSLDNPVPSEFYKQFGREKPPLTGTYEEQVALVVNDVTWWKGVRNGIERQMAVQRALPRVAKKRAVTELKQRLCNLPSSISADMNTAINTGRDYFTGRFWPRYNLGYQDEGIIQIDYASPPQGRISEYSPNEFTKYRIFTDSIGWNTAVLLDRNGNIALDNGRTNLYTAHSLKALMRYLDAENNAGEFERNRPTRMCDSVSIDKIEFWNLVNRVGEDFSGTLKFRKNSFITERQGLQVTFDRMGLRASSPSRELSFAVYYTETRRSEEGHYMEAFNMDFNEWLSLDVTRQVAHLGYGSTTVMLEERK